jgi:hypothetical protein
MNRICHKAHTLIARNDEKFLETALIEMFRRVGRKYSPQATSKFGWYNKSTWTSAEQREFRRWLTQLIRQELGYRVAIAKMAAGGFVLNYGWKVDEEKYMRAPRRRCEARSAPTQS